MTNLSQVIEKYKVKVEDSYPSIFTKTDVIGLLENIQNELTEKPDVPSLDVIQDLKQRLKEVVYDIDIEGNVDLELSGNCVEVSYCIDDLTRQLMDVVDEVYDEVFVG